MLVLVLEAETRFIFIPVSKLLPRRDHVELASLPGTDVQSSLQVVAAGFPNRFLFEESLDHMT